MRPLKSIEESDKLIKKDKPGYYQYAWYMWFKKLQQNIQLVFQFQEFIFTDKKFV